MTYDAADGPVDYTLTDKLIDNSPAPVQRFFERKTPEAVADTFRKGRLLENWVPDIIAGNTSRTPLYALADYFLVGASVAKTAASAAWSLGFSACGWAAVYLAGKKGLQVKMGDRYNKKVENAYSLAMTAGFGAIVSWASDFTLVEIVSSTVLRTAISSVLGTPTRLATDYLRNATGEEELIYSTPLKYASKPTRWAAAAAITLGPVAVTTTTISEVPDPVRERTVELYHDYFVDPTVEAIQEIPTLTDIKELYGIE